MNLRRPTVHYREPLFDASNLAREGVEDYARQVAEAAGVSPPVDMIRLVEKCGGKVHYQEVDEWRMESGSIFVHGKRDFDILLPLYTSPRRDQFTLAHELGHYFLHSQQGKIPLVAHRQGTKSTERVEWEANWFAAALLMPEAEFRVAADRSRDPVLLAREFRVSSDAATIRLKVLLP